MCFHPSSFIDQAARVAGLLPLSKYHQLSSAASNNEARRNESSGGADSISLEENGTDKVLVCQSKDLVHHQGEVLVHHQVKGSVLVRFPDLLPSESGPGSIHQQRRKDQEMPHNQSKTPSDNDYDDRQSDPRYTSFR